MVLTIILELPNKIAENAQHAAGDHPVAELSDEQILSLTKLQMDEAAQSELSELLAQNREDTLDASGGQLLEQLMAVIAIIWFARLRRSRLRRNVGWAYLCH